MCYGSVSLPRMSLSAAATNYTWLKEGGDMPSGKRVNSGVLLLPSVTSGDAGSYTCIASNINGGARATAALSVIEGENFK